MFYYLKHLTHIRYIHATFYYFIMGLQQQQSFKTTYTRFLQLKKLTLQIQYSVLVISSKISYFHFFFSLI